MPLASIGHNNGPTLEPGGAWRTHCWTRARAELLPTLPIEVVRLRVRRAAEIGLDYRTYASFRAASGHDIVALLFSTNALRLLPPKPALPADRHAKLEQIVATGRGALVHRPLSIEDLLEAAPGLLDQIAPAPRAFASWSETRQAVTSAIRAACWPADGVLMIGDNGEERGWSEAGRLAGYLPAERYFAAPA